ncbi:DUF4214 domain-containing protein [Rhizobium sp. LjRoot30]|uniref:DUF4214 domain-containing protein n=1 Tax=Rhizobium sp. LjRoot30 TaxID=3342320 RepID=UPI003F5022F0
MTVYTDFAVAGAPTSSLFEMSISGFNITSSSSTLMVVSTPSNFELRITGNNLSIDVVTKPDGTFEFVTGGTITGLSRTSVGGSIVYESVTDVPNVPFKQPATDDLSALVKAAFAGNDTFDGSDRAEKFFAGSGDDKVNGKGGFDLSVYSGAAADYGIASQNGTITVTDKTASRDGTDTLTGIERLVFTDEIVAFDSLAAQAYRVYEAAFNRTPDKGGLSYWVNALDHGASLRDVAAGFASSDEFRSIYGSNPTTEDIVTRFYVNVLDRQPDAAGIAYWVDQIKSGRSVADALLGFSESSENIANLQSTIGLGVHLDPTWFAA